jgi:hypothetical protein
MRAPFLVIICLLNSLLILGQHPDVIIQKPHQYKITNIDFNKSNSLLYTFSPEEKLIKIWNPRYGKLLKDIDLSFTNSQPYGYVVTNGKSLVVYDNNAIQLYTNSGEKIGSYPLSYGDRTELVRETGNILILHSDGTLYLFNTITGKVTTMVSKPSSSPFFHINPGGLLTYGTRELVLAFETVSGNLIDSITISTPPSNIYQFGIPFFIDNITHNLAILRENDIIILNAIKHETIGKIKCNSCAASTLTQLYFTPGFEKVLLFGHDSLCVFNTASSMQEYALSTYISPTRVDSVSPHIIQINSFGKTSIFNWKENKIILNFRPILDGVDHLNGGTNNFVVNNDESFLYTFYGDTLYRKGLKESKILSKFVADFRSEITNITSDGAGDIFLCGYDKNNKSIIQVWDQNTCTYKSTIPDFSYAEYQSSLAPFSDSLGDIYTSGPGLGIKHWAFSKGTVLPIANSKYPLIVDQNIFVTQDDEDTGRIRLQVRDLKTNKMLKQVISPIFNGMDFFREGVVSHGKFFLPTNFSNTYYEWDTSSNRMTAFQGPDALCLVLSNVNKDFISINGRTSIGKMMLLNTKEQIKKSNPVPLNADIGAVSPNDSVIASVLEFTGGLSELNRVITINIYNLFRPSDKQNIRLLFKYASVSKIKFSADGNYLCLTTLDGLILLKRNGADYAISYTDTSGIFYRVNDFCFDRTSTTLFYVTSEKKIISVKLNDKNLSKSTHDLSAVPKTISCNSDKIIISEEGDLVQVFDYNITYKFLCLDLGENQWQILLPEGYYFSSKNIAAQIGFSIWPNYYSFQQFDVRFNRPDLVCNAIGSTNTVLTNFYKKAYDKRIKRLGVSDTSQNFNPVVPEVDFSNRNDIKYEQSTRFLTLAIKGRSTRKLIRLNLWINENPLYGIRGIDFSYTNKYNLDTTITIELSNGKNQIEVALTDSSNAESYHIPLYVNFKSSLRDKHKIYFIGVGINKFREPGHDLQWSVKDVQDLSKSLKAKFGDACIIDTLFNENTTISNIAAIKENLLKTNIDDEVIILYSGHGLLNKTFDYFLSTYDVNFSNPGEGGLPYENIEELLDSIPARKKLLLLDACHSGELDKEDLLNYKEAEPSLQKNGIARGVTLENTDSSNIGLQNSFALMQELFVDVGKNTGATVISAAAGTQLAMERGDLKNGVFTFCILEYLKNNQHALISNFKNYVNTRVSQLTSGLQVPTSRSQAVLYDWEVW